MITFTSTWVQRLRIPPISQPAGERLQVKARSAAGMLKQILYCVRSPQRTPFAAYERPISAG